MLNYQSKSAFTLIEMLIVIIITGIIASMVVANMRSGGRSIDIKSDAEKLAGIIKQAQMMSLSGEQFGSPAARPDGGYGVYVTTSSYKLFINDNAPSSHQYDDGSDTVVQSFDFTTGVEASSIDHSYIIFVSPQGTIYVTPGNELTGGSTSSIILEQTQETLHAYIKLNSQGNIDVY